MNPLQPVLSAVACNLDNRLLQAALPLFAEAQTEAIEWSFDALYRQQELPNWFEELLQTFGNAGRLTGHGIFFSLFSAKWTREQQQWLDQLRQFTNRFRFDHISEHFGFMTGRDFHKGAPMPVPLTASTLHLGTDRLKRIYDACGVPVGLENLAFATSVSEVWQHGDFLYKLIAPVNGFLILDLHNLYCQLHNFDVAFDELIRAYPLERVREIHISGGSWEQSSTDHTRTIRRDTHDDTVPQEVFDLLKAALPRCPNVRFVVLEQLGSALNTPEQQVRFRSDFRHMQTIIGLHNQQLKPSIAPDFLPDSEISFLLPDPPEDSRLYRQQQELSAILENAPDVATAQRLLQASSLGNTEWNTEKWKPEMLETAMHITQKWRNGWEKSH